MPNPKKVSVIICGLNTRDILDKSLENLTNIYAPLEVIVIDNDSFDGSDVMVAKKYPWVIRIQNKNNGLSDAYNKGLKIATGDYILYMGSDAFPVKGKTIEGMIEHLDQNPQTGAVTVKLIKRDGTIDMDCHRGIPTPWASLCHFTKLDKLFPKSKLFAEYFKSYEDLDTDHEIGLTISHFMMVPRKVQDTVGLWDEKYFLYGEDVDMCYRLIEAGYKIMYLGHLTAGHWKGVVAGRKETADVIITEGKGRIKDKEMSRRDYYLYIRTYSIESMKEFYMKHYQKKYPKILLWGVLFALQIQLIVRKYSWLKFYDKLVALNEKKKTTD